MIAEHLRLPPGPVDLSALPTDATPGFDGGKSEGQEALGELGEELSDLQERLYAEGRSGGSRSVLLVLQDKGLIKLRPEAGLKATPLDVIDNPKKIKFVELDAAQMPRSLDDLDAAAINTNFALQAGLTPAKDAIAQENAKSPYVNILVVREQDKDKPWVSKLIKAYHSEEIRQFIQTAFKGSVLPGF